MNSTVRLEDEKPFSVVPYVCWVGTLALGFYNLVYAREVVISLFVVAGVDPKILLLVDKVGFFLFAVVGLLIILLTEPYFRKGWQQGRLGERVLRVVAVGCAWLSVSFAVLLGLPGLAEAARPSIGILAASAAGLTICGWLHRRALRGQENH